ncbi:hypothetical protein [Nannocystis pusilla]|uniref:hypothetical protein n=1 Tax=Nannocystis pusilla TaxID=889268 RepID=UPI003B7B05D7
MLVAGGPAWANPPAPVLPKPSGPPPPPPAWMPAGEAQRQAETPVGNATWRPGKGIELATPDRRFTINFNMWAQLRPRSGARRSRRRDGAVVRQPRVQARA